MKIIVAKLGTARGKVRKIFLKRFLEQTDFNYIICQTQEEVKKNIEKNDAVICLYNEDRNSNLKEKFGFLDEYTDIYSI